MFILPKNQFSCIRSTGPIQFLSASLLNHTCSSCLIMTLMISAFSTGYHEIYFISLFPLWGGSMMVSLHFLIIHLDNESKDVTKGKHNGLTKTENFVHEHEKAKKKQWSQANTFGVTRELHIEGSPYRGLFWESVPSWRVNNCKMEISCEIQDFVPQKWAELVWTEEKATEKIWIWIYEYIAVWYA
jgi:hypothetical protein